MADFTMALKDVLRVTNGNIGLDTYPVFDEAYRAGLTEKIQNHYWNREIGVESIEMFRFNMRRKMAEIMPYYNQLYKSEQIKFDPLSTMDIETVANNTQTSESTAASTATNSASQLGNGITVNSTFPQQALRDNDTGNYADSSAESKTDTTSSGNGTEDRTEKGNGSADSESRSKGYSGPAADLLMRYRASLLNIDMLVIADLQELFMFVWNTNDTFTENGYVL